MNTHVDLSPSWQVKFGRTKGMGPKKDKGRGVKNFFAHSPSRTSGWKKALALMTFSLALIYGSNFWHYVDSVHHYVMYVICLLNWNQ